jgi:DNA primase large subunit
MDGLDFAVKYPFTSEAKAIVENATLTDRVIELGLERIKKSLKGDDKAKMLIDETGKREDIASYAAARMILGSLRNTFITSKFAVNESKVVRNHLDKESMEGVRKVAARFGIEPAKKDGRKVLDLPTYLRYSIRAPYYRLINRKLREGFVEVGDNDLRRLVEEAVRKHTEEIPLVKDAPEAVKRAGERLLLELPKSETTIVVKEGDHPPCILQLLENAKKHQNLNHSARYFLATYLNKIGMGDDAMVGIYSQLPDFNERTTRYQITHLKKKEYSVPSCSTVTTYGLCVATCRIGTPIRWHKINEHKKKEILG